MLKRDFDKIYNGFLNFLLSTNIGYLSARKYGQRDLKGIDTTQAFMISELLAYVHRANKNRNPAASIVIPAQIEWSNLNRVLTTVRTITHSKMFMS